MPSDDSKSRAELVLTKIAERYRPVSTSAFGPNRSGSATRSDAPRSTESIRPVPSCPPAMLKRIETAKQSISDDRARAQKDGRPYHPVFGPLGFTEMSVAIFECLACDPNMEPAWQTLVGVFDDNKRCPDTWAFVSFCHEVIGAWEFSPRRTRKEHRDHFSKIADDILGIAGTIICEPEFGMIGTSAATVRPLEMIEDKSLRWLMDQLDADPIDGTYIRTEEDAVSFARFCLSDIVPDLYRYAEWVAAKARRIADQPSISERPHGENSQRTYFVKHLSKWFRTHHQQPFHEVVANVASALFREDISADTVRKAAASDPDISFSFRRGKPPSNRGE